MEIERWDIYKEISIIHEEVDRIFQDFFRKIPIIRSDEEITAFIPPVNMIDDEDKIFVQVALPGVKKENIELSIQNRILTVSGVRLGILDKQYYQQEWQYGNFERKIIIPVGINDNNIHADYIDGILTITIPKSEN